MLVDLGFKEIECSFPSASVAEFEFTRRLIETEGAVPDDVWLQVIVPCREDLIRRTVEAVRGAKKVIFHIFLATSECFQRIVFDCTQEQNMEMAVNATRLARALTKDDPSQSKTEWNLEFTPEHWSDTDQDFSIRVCNAVKEAWGPTHEKIIYNLTATVEMSTPNIFADLVESFCTRIDDRNDVCVSVHAHNDRGCAVAASEQAQMAGADRVEGTVFGNGERTGNVDLVTMALNLYTQGVNPILNFSNIDSVIEVVEDCTQIPVHPRAPYAGQLVHTAFSGSHQDAINKGFKYREHHSSHRETPIYWQIPYLPLDPADIGRTHENVIRVNSLSGKGGVEWTIRNTLQLDLPKKLQVAFAKEVQGETDAKGRELDPREVKDKFKDLYSSSPDASCKLIDYNITADSPDRHPDTTTLYSDAADSQMSIEGTILLNGVRHQITGNGTCVLSSFADALRGVGITVHIAECNQQVTQSGDAPPAHATFVEVRSTTSDKGAWGVDVDQDGVKSGLKALLSSASTVSFFPPPFSASFLWIVAKGCFADGGDDTQLSAARPDSPLSA